MKNSKIITINKVDLDSLAEAVESEKNKRTF